MLLLSAEADQPTTHTHLQLSQELGLQEQLQQLHSELQRQHELPSLEGYEEHPLGDPLRLRSQFWELEVDTTTGSNSPNAPDALLTALWYSYSYDYDYYDCCYHDYCCYVYCYYHHYWYYY